MSLKAISLKSGFFVFILLFLLIFLFWPSSTRGEVSGWLKYRDEVVLSAPPELLIAVPTATRPAGISPLARVKEVLVEPGEKVKEGQLLIILENELVGVFLEQAKANITLLEARQKLLEEKKKEVEDKLSEVKEGKNRMNKAESEAKVAFRKGVSQSEEALSEVSHKLTEIKVGKNELQSAMEEIGENIKVLGEQIEEVKKLPDSDPTKAPLLQDLQKKLNELLIQQEALSRQWAELEKGEEELMSAQEEIKTALTKAQAKYRLGLRKISAGRARLKKAESQLFKAEKEIDFQLSLFPLYLKQAKAFWRLANTVSSSTQLRALRGGKVVEARVKPGEVVYPGQVLVRIVDDSKLYFEGYLPVEAESYRFKGNYRLKVDSFPGQYFATRLFVMPIREEFAMTTVITRENELARVRRLVLEVDNSSGLLKAGFPAEVVFKERKN